MRMNPEELQEDKAYVLTDPVDKKPFVQPVAASPSTTLDGGQLGHLVPIVAAKDERPDIAYGVGTMTELDSRLTEEDEPVPYVYESRLVGKRIKEAMHYPKIPFDYTIEKVGTRLVDDRSVGYSLRVDAHPQKLIKGEITHEMRTDKEHSYEAELEINTTSPRNEYRSRIRWDGIKEVSTQSDVKEIFVSKSTLHVTGKGKNATWQKRDGQVIDVKNAPWFSGVISGTHIKKSHYEAEFEFTPTYTTDQKYTIVRRVTSGYKVVKPSGHSKKKYWDDDIVGMIFKAKSKTDFYVLLWESDERLGRSSRVGDISGRHVTDEQLFLRDTFVSPVGPGMTKVSKAKWDDYTKKKGWGQNHAKVYRVVNGVFHKVSLTDKRKENEGWTFGVRQGMRVVSQGKKVKLYLKNRSSAPWKLAFEFNSAYEEGSFGMCNISQAVLFHKIRYVENQKISGVIPQSGWNRTKKPSMTLTSDTMGYVLPYAKRAAGGKKCEVLNVRAEEDPKTAKFGVTTVKFPKGGITIKTQNPDKSKLKTYTFTQTGSMTVTPDRNTPSKGVTAFDGALNLFKAQLDRWQKNHPEQKIVDYDFDLIEPTMKGDDDWDLIGSKNEKLVFWNSKVKEQKVEVSIPVFAYQGKVNHPLSEWFSLNPYSTASFDIDEESYDRWHDEWILSGGGESLSLNVRTTEWYKGVQAEHLRLYGTVSSKKPLTIPMPAMPEHYVHPVEEGPMYHGHEVVHYTLLQMAPTDGTAFATFEDAGDATTERANEKNVTTGQPLVMTTTQLDKIYVKAKPNPRLVPWRSGSKTGSSSVNGIRPFLSAARGKQDVRISTKDLKEPEDLASLDKIDIRTTDGRVQVDQKGTDIIFSSNHQSGYRYTRGWHGSWVNDLTPRTALKRTQVIHDGVVLDPKADPNYDASVLIEGIEGRASTPFVRMKGRAVDPTARGLVGRYHQKPSSLELIEETVTLTGEIQRYEQIHQVPAWLQKQEINMIYGSKIVSVSMDGRTLASSEYTISAEVLTIIPPALTAGELKIQYQTGEIERQYSLKKVHGDNVKVYLGSTKLTEDQYTLSTGRIVLKPSLLLKSNDTVTIRSIKIAQPYGKDDLSLGRYVGARIDNEIWYDWGTEGPFPLVDNVQAQASGLHEATVEAVVAYDERTQRPLEETATWRQYDAAPITDKVNYGTWVATTEGYDDLAILTNGMLTAKISPVLRSNRVGIFSNVLMRSLDNDAAGLIIQSEDKVTSFVFGWDTNGTGFRGIKVQKWVCKNPDQQGATTLSYTKTNLYENPILFGEPAADPNNMAGVAEHTMQMILDKGKKTIAIWADGVKLTEFSIEAVTGDFSVGVFAESQPETRYRDIETIEEKVITALDAPALSQTFMKEIEPPISTGATNQFEYAINDKTMDQLFGPVGKQLSVERGFELYRMSYTITNQVSSGSVYFDQTMTKSTELATDQVMVLIEGVPMPVAPPAPLPQDTVSPPNIPDEELPPVSMSDAFAIEWTGYLQVNKTGVHVFEVTANESVILEVDGKVIMESFNNYDGAVKEARIELQGGTLVRFRIRYYENRSYAYIRLRMKEPNSLMRRIPKSRFIPYTGFIMEAKKSVQYPEPWDLQIKAGDLFMGKEERHLYAKPKVEQLSLDQNMSITLSELPRMGAPIHVQRGANTYKEITIVENNEKTLYHSLRYTREGATRIKLPSRQIDAALITVRRNGIKEPFEIEGQGLMLAAPIMKGDTIDVRFADPLTFYTTIDDGKVSLHFAENIGPEYGAMFVTYETADDPWKKTGVLLNPVRSRQKEMIFLEDVPSGEVAQVILKLSESHIAKDENPRIVATVQVKDALGNAMEQQDVALNIGIKVVQLKTDDAGFARYVFSDVANSVIIIARCGDAFDARPLMKNAQAFRIQLRQQGDEAWIRKESLEGVSVTDMGLTKVITATGITPYSDLSKLTLPVGQSIVITQVGNDMVRIACQRNE